MKTLILCLGILVFPLSSLASQQRAQKVAGHFDQALACADRMWPQLSRVNFRVVMASENLQSAWFYSSQDNDVSTVDLGELSEWHPHADYQFLKSFRGDRAVLINFDQLEEQPKLQGLEVDRAFNLAFHESFHWLFQMKAPWTSQFVSHGERTELDRAQALYLRKMLIRTLREAVLGDAPLGAAAYWYQEWLKTGEEPETAWSDIVEGTAHYTEAVATVIAAKGCETSEPEIQQKLAENLNQLLSPMAHDQILKQLFAEYLKSGYQTDGYEIGLLSLLLLRQVRPNVFAEAYPLGRDYGSELQKAEDPQEKIKVYNELQAALKDIKTPAALLLEDVEPIPQNDDLKLQDRIKRIIDELENTQISN